MNPGTTRLILHSLSPGCLPLLARFSRLEWLYMEGDWSSLSGTGDEVLEVIRGLTSLKRLELRSMAIRGPGLVHLQGMTALERLDLSCNRMLTSDGLASLPVLPNLRVLLLNETAVADPLPAIVLRLPALAELGVAETQLTASAREALHQARPALVIWEEGAKSR